MGACCVGGFGWVKKRTWAVMPCRAMLLLLPLYLVVSHARIQHPACAPCIPGQAHMANTHTALLWLAGWVRRVGAAHFVLLQPAQQARCGASLSQPCKGRLEGAERWRFWMSFRHVLLLLQVIPSTHPPTQTPNQTKLKLPHQHTMSLSIQPTEKTQEIQKNEHRNLD